MPLVEKTLVTNPRPSLANNNARPTPANKNPRPTQGNSNTRPSQENNLVIANNNARPTPANNNPRSTQGNSNTRPSRENNLVMSAPPTPVNNVVMTVPPPSVVDLEAEAAKKECWVKNKPLFLVFRAVALFSSALSFFVMVTIEDFIYYITQDSVMCYVFVIASMVMVYIAVFVGIHGHEIRMGHVVIPPKIAVWMNVFGDQILALLLLSAASSAGELLSRRMQGYVNLDTALGAGSAGMAFIAFLALEPAALISMYNFSAYRLKS